MVSQSVIPAQAGIQTSQRFEGAAMLRLWIPAIEVPAKYYFAGYPCAGTTNESVA